MLDGMETRDRTCVVTGASRGLGAGIARELARLGMRLGLCSRGAPELPPSERVVAERVDVTDEAALRAFAGRVVARFGRIDLWINNAGVTGPLGPLRKAAGDDIALTIAVNVGGVVNGTRAYLDVLRGEPGVLVNMSSGVARSAVAGLAMYSATKAAVERLSEAVQLEEPGLRVYSISPGLIETDMQEKIRAMGEADVPMSGWFREVKRREAFSTPEFVARQIAAIAFDPARRPAQVAFQLELEHELP
jgi:benzil reductase ((S)-benzoin forming)